MRNYFLLTIIHIINSENTHNSMFLNNKYVAVDFIILI